jgi:hypothetical protein
MVGILEKLTPVAMKFDHGDAKKTTVGQLESRLDLEELGVLFALVEKFGQALMISKVISQKLQLS